MELSIPPDDLLDHVAEDRRLVECAHEATTRRLADLSPDAPGYRAARDLVRYWQRTLVELDRQLADLETRRQTRQHVERVLRR